MSETNAKGSIPRPPAPFVEVRPGVWQIPPIEVFRMWPKKLRAKQDEQLSAPAIDFNDAKAVLTRFRERLDDWDFNLSLGDRLTKEGVELGASPEDRKRVHEAVSTLLFQQHAELMQLLPHAGRHLAAVGLRVGTLDKAMDSPTRKRVRKAKAAIADALARLDSPARPAAADPDAIDRAAERVAEKAIRALAAEYGARTKALPARTEVVLWEGAAHTEHNIRLARTRTAYLESHGSVPDALAALAQSGHTISRSTFYNHLNALDEAIPGWRTSVQPSKSVGNLDEMRTVRTRGKPRDKVR